MEQTKDEIEVDTTPDWIQAILDIIDAICLSSDEQIEIASSAHSAISSPLLGIKADEPEKGLGFLSASKSYNRNWIPNLPPLRSRTYEEYMGRLRFRPSDINDSIIILYSLSGGVYHAKCLECGALFKADNETFHSGLCPVHQKNQRWVSVADITMGRVPGYSSGVRVIKQNRSYIPK